MTPKMNTKTPRVTRNLVLALQRAAALLPGARVEPLGGGRYLVAYHKGPDAVMEKEGKPTQCLAFIVLALTTDPQFGGLGTNLAQVREAVQLHPGAVPVRGLAAHELSRLRGLAVRL